MSPLPPRGERPWWRDAVIYQIYPRSFADANGDGMGDMAGIRSRLPYLRDLGVDAIWISPFYRSPMNDAGYDVADYETVDPSLGTTEDAELLIREAHDLGIRVIFDIVPNHTSSEHPWFQEALRTPPGEGMWARYHCLPGRGEHGEEPPNDWRCTFGGIAWTQIPDAEGNPTGWWYLHLFDHTQPDVNWENPDVRAEYERVLRHWFDRGVDGFRIDVAHGLVKAPGYPPSGETEDNIMGVMGEIPEQPQWDQPGVHEVFREWRAVADSYDPPKVFVGEVWVGSPERLARYLRPDELHTAFNFDYLKTPWWSDGMRQVIDSTTESAGLVGAPCTWVLSNHDVWRHATRLAPIDQDGVIDAERGLARARAGTLFMLALPGSAYVYQGEELGLPEVLDIPAEDRQDPVFFRTGGVALGRDGCRVPLPWSGTEPSYGFGPGPLSWLPQPPIWADLSVERQTGDPGSTLELYRTALAVRRAEPALGDGDWSWRELKHPHGRHLLAVERPARDGGGGVLAVVNVGKDVATLPASWGTEVLVASGDGVAVVTSGDAEDEGLAAVALAPETAVWLRA
ncbi:MAG: glycoside hydrolase family 13 protein [Candidatus Nanopelagicales bacterium]